MIPRSLEVGPNYAQKSLAVPSPLAQNGPDEYRSDRGSITFELAEIGRISPVLGSCERISPTRRGAPKLIATSSVRIADQFIDPNLPGARMAIVRVARYSLMAARLGSQILNPMSPARDW
jgi:hypothetical protein